MFAAAHESGHGTSRHDPICSDQMRSGLGWPTGEMERFANQVDAGPVKLTL
jgi:hypothetical protein